MTEWVEVKNYHRLMQGIESPSWDCTGFRGLASYFEELIAQNKRIIELLEEIDGMMRL